MPAMMTLKAKHSLLLKYGSIGGMATAVHYVVFMVLLTIVSPVWSTLWGGVCGAIFSYYANKRFTFIGRADKTLKAHRFYFVTLLYNIANTGIMYLITQIWPSEQTFYWVFVQCGITVVLSVISYFIHKYWSYHNV